MRRTLKTGITAIVFVASIAVPTQVAIADPSGCSAGVTAGYDGAGYLHSHATGNCNGLKSLTLYAEVKEDLSGVPDKLIAKNSVNGYQSAFAVDAYGCNNGETSYYYGRGYFSTNTTYHDTSHTLVHAC